MNTKDEEIEDLKAQVEESQTLRIIAERQVEFNEIYLNTDLQIKPAPAGRVSFLRVRVLNIDKNRKSARIKMNLLGGRSFANRSAGEGAENGPKEGAGSTEECGASIQSRRHAQSDGRGRN